MVELSGEQLSAVSGSRYGAMLDAKGCGYTICGPLKIPAVRSLNRIETYRLGANLG